MPVICPQCGKLHETLEEMKEKAMRLNPGQDSSEPIPRKLKLKRKKSEDAF